MVSSVAPTVNDGSFGNSENSSGGSGEELEEEYKEVTGAAAEYGLHPVRVQDTGSVPQQARV